MEGNSKANGADSVFSKAYALKEISGRSPAKDKIRGKSGGKRENFA